MRVQRSALVRKRPVSRQITADHLLRGCHTHARTHARTHTHTYMHTRPVRTVAKPSQHTGSRAGRTRQWRRHSTHPSVSRAGDQCQGGAGGHEERGREGEGAEGRPSVAALRGSLLPLHRPSRVHARSRRPDPAIHEFVCAWKWKKLCLGRSSAPQRGRPDATCHLTLRQVTSAPNTGNGVGGI